MITSQQALSDIRQAFPQLARELDDDAGLLHLQLASFARLTQRFITQGEKANFARACDLFGSHFAAAAPDLENAYNVSFLELLDFEGDGGWAFAAMPPLMQAAWQAMADYNQPLDP